MSYWNYITGEIVTFPPKKCKQYPKWDEIDCGCSGGLEWGGEEPRECKRCGGNGIVYKHRKTGLFAKYPGGPFTY